MSVPKLALSPISGKSRIAVLDIMRGIAILAIFFMNLPFMGYPGTELLSDPRYLGWTSSDQFVFAFNHIFLDGTQRCLLEFLFGAGMMILTKRAMAPDGPVAVADVYMRRTMWLMVFGLVDLYGLLWRGDILFTYAFAALFLLPFRRLTPRWLLLLGSVFAIYQGLLSWSSYSEQVNLATQVELAHQHGVHGTLTDSDRMVMREWNNLKRDYSLHPDDEFKQKTATEDSAHAHGYFSYANYVAPLLTKGFFTLRYTWIASGEAFFTMLLGMALWKWGILQGERSSRFYGLTALIAYSIGLSLRAESVVHVFAFSPVADWTPITSELARLAVGLGHLGLINWAVQTRAGWNLLAPFRAPGRMAFSIYFCQQIIGMHILFSPYGLNLWERLDWAQIQSIAFLVSAVILIASNIWLRYFAMGPLEFVWRSLTYLKLQPFRQPWVACDTQPVA